MKNGAKLDETGFICLSKKKRNCVTSNFIGCSAYYGHLQILKDLSDKINKSNLEFQAGESPDKNSLK
jgi:hypothetical protein